MDLEELKQRVAVEQLTRQAIMGDAEVDIIEVEPDTEKSERALFYYDENDVRTMMSLLESSMRMLGFFGDKELSGTIMKKDRERMEKLATEIKVFIDLTYAYQPED